MIYLQDISLLILICMAIACVVLIVWVYMVDIRERKKHTARGTNREFHSKMRYWRTYLSAGLGFLILLCEIFRRLYF